MNWENERAKYITYFILLVKNKCGNLCDTNNYRPIALSTIASKCFELILLHRCENYLCTTDFQFGFKKHSSTDLCIYVLRECLQTYRNHATPVFVTFLDASKAFDRVNHWSLFYKLVKRNTPLYLVRILLYWYQNQAMCVRWGNSFSSKFVVRNGVRQGGVLSPLLFNVYMDDLSCDLSAEKIGCNIGGLVINHLAYADDLCLISPSSAGMQKLLNICDQYGKNHDLIYNCSKCLVMCFSPNKVTLRHNPDLYLDSTKLEFVDHYKYLGTQVEANSCAMDIKRQLKKFYTNVNRLIRVFNKCSTPVKCYLFRTYCSYLYCSQFWYNNRKCDMTSVKTAYNNGLRRLLGLPRSCSASFMFVSSGVPSFGELLRKSIHSFIKRVSNSVNNILINIVASTIPCTSSIWSWWRDIMHFTTY